MFLTFLFRTLAGCLELVFQLVSKNLYQLVKEICKLFGNVRLQKGDSFLLGEYAEVDLKRGISKLMPAPKKSNFAEDRVKALINKEGVEIISEVTPHHLFLNENWVYGKNGIIPDFIDLDSYDTNFRVNPPIRQEEDRLALLEGIKDGTIDIIATDHAPHSDGDKLNTFDSAPAGINGAETALPTLLTIVNKGELHITDVIRTMSNTPAKILNKLLDVNIGKLKKNFQADFTLIDNDKKNKITEDFFISKSKNSPLIGNEMIGQVKMTILGGKIVHG